MGGRPPVDDETANQRLRQLATVLAKVDGQSGSVELEVVDEGPIPGPRFRPWPALAGLAVVLALGIPGAWFALQARPEAPQVYWPEAGVDAAADLTEPPDGGQEAAGNDAAADASPPASSQGAPPRRAPSKPLVRRVRRRSVQADPDATLAPTID